MGIVLAAVTGASTASGASGKHPALPSMQATAPLQGNRITFYRTQAGTSHIWVVNADGTSPTQLTSGPSQDKNPIWSPDGSKIAYQSNAGGSQQLWVMNADGSSPRQLTFKATNYQPGWAPEGSKIAFVSTRTGHKEIFTIDAVTGTVQQITNDAADVGYPAWAPDASGIAFQSDKGGVTGIWFWDPIGAPIESETTEDSTPDTQPAWDPGSQTIAYVNTQGGVGHIWALSSPPPASVYTSGPDSDGAPSWSLSGYMLVFQRTASPGSTQLWEMQRGGGAQTAITPSTAGVEDLHPSWQPVSPGLALDNYMAEKNVLEALSTAQQYVNAHGSYASLTSAAMSSLDPYLNYVDGVSPAYSTVSVGVDSGQSFGAAAMGRGGLCLLIHSTLGTTASSGIFFGSTVAEANCTGTVALAFTTSLSPAGGGW